MWETESTSKEAKYKSPKRVIDMLVDIVSRHGNLLLKFPLPNSGYLDSQELRTLSELTAWMAIKGDGIFSSRPRKNLMTFVLRCSEPACRPHPASLPVRVPSVDSLLHACFSFTTRLRFAARYGCRHRLRLAPFIPLDSAHAVHTPQADPWVTQPARSGLLSMQNLAVVVLFLPKRTSCLSRHRIGPLGCNSFQGLGSVWAA